MKGAVGQRFRRKVHLLPRVNLRQLLLVDIGFDPNLAEIGNREERIARVDVLPLCHLAIYDRSRDICVDGHVGHALGFRRADLISGDAPKLQLALACLDKRIRLLARSCVVRLMQQMAVLLRQPILVERRRHFGTIYVGHCLTPLDALASVLHIELVHASADARAHGGKLRFRLLDAAKSGDVCLQ